MKKIITTVAIAILGMAANAASCEWAAVGLAGIDGTTESISASNIYAFDTSVLTQQALLDAFTAGTLALKRLFSQ